MGEIFLYLSYGKFHLIEVVIRAIEIPQRSVTQPICGFCSTLACWCTIVILGEPKIAMEYGCFDGQSVLCSDLCVVYVGNEQCSNNFDGIFEFGIFGYHIGFLIFDSQNRATMERRLLQLWVVVVWVGIVATHNYAAPRYWILAMLPMVLLIPPSQIKTSWIGLCALWSVGLLWAEHQFANQGFWQ